jgi:hypothetical protein
MKKVVLVMLLASVYSVAMSQLQRPMASPVGKLEQKVGLTDVKVEYSRPSKNNRVVFEDVVELKGFTYPFEKVRKRNSH